MNTEQIIESLKIQLSKISKKLTALKDENALLKDEIERLKKGKRK